MSSRPHYGDRMNRARRERKELLELAVRHDERLKPVLEMEREVQKLLVEQSHIKDRIIQLRSQVRLELDKYFITVTEASIISGLPRQQIIDHIRSTSGVGHVVGVRIGDTWWIDRKYWSDYFSPNDEDVESWISRVST